MRCVAAVITVMLCGVALGEEPAADRWRVTPAQRLIARVVFAEGCGEPMQGKIAIAAVILNRLTHPDYPSDLEGVVYQPQAFSAYWEDSRLWQLGARPGLMNAAERAAWAESMEAAKRAMLGEGDGSIIAFRHVRMRDMRGYFGRLVEVATIGRHRFYAAAASAAALLDAGNPSQ